MSEAITTAAAGAAPLTPARKLRLWAEFLALFVGTPVLMVAFFGQYPLFPLLFALAAMSALLLAVTPGFRFRELIEGPVLYEWRLILGFVVMVALACTTVALVLVPERFLELPRQRPELWLLIMVAYPIASVVPQELIYRPLFFRRYGRLFPNVGTAVVANAAAFGLGHLFFLNWVTISMTAVGGAVMAWAYMRHRSFLLACVLHAVAGQIVFTTGLGIFFYHGAIMR
ncbi:CPBP family intramembrane metalloprotease [Limibaculum sp. M0105]|uniref:CPBP family intramembrane metalloprotease n=1 Tax=Thermohalobaculum xanthum TaxID=2753746 RepID=A0A8J7SDY7_9RHOB|nr:CPBP family intramembrane glutamic endopeptidase [Thermohalobaculum xanthum]MBK0397565.1 CPBP family intramembrane metalloprotease [Thermohalobaculum xanthum]